MYRLKISTYVLSGCLLFLASTQVQAVSISIAEATFDWRSLIVNGEGYELDDFLVDAEVSLFNDMGLSRFSDGDDAETYIDQSSANVSGEAGFSDIFEEYGALTSSRSIFSDLNSASAEASSVAYLEVVADASEEFNVSFLYDLFVLTDSSSPGEYALAISSINFSLLDEFFDDVEFGLSDDLLAVSAGVGTIFFEKDGIFDFTFSNLEENEVYFLAVEAFAFSATEAVPEPATFLLMLIGLALIVRTKLLKSRISYYKSLQLA